MEPDRAAGSDPHRIDLYRLPDFGPAPDPESDYRAVPVPDDRSGDDDRLSLRKHVWNYHLAGPQHARSV